MCTSHDKAQLNMCKHRSNSVKGLASEVEYESPEVTTSVRHPYEAEVFSKLILDSK